MGRAGQPRDGERFDALVVGAGFGGMGAALALAEGGARVALCEALTYPGGCASTFSRGDYRFEAGATLFSGFAEGQRFRRLLDQHHLDVQVDLLDPVVELRLPGLVLPVDADRQAFVDRLAALPGAPADQVHRFFAWQRQVADALWALLDDPTLLPPLGPGDLLRHLPRLPAYAPLASVVGRPLLRVLERFGVHAFQPLRAWVDAVCQITVQASAAQAEAPFALGAMDYFWRGTGHVRGGIGRLAEALCDAIERSGGRVCMGARVRGLRREAGGWACDVRGRTLHARVVVANTLPREAAALAGEDSGPLRQLQAEVAGGWGACMLYLGVDEASLAHPGAHHLELVADPGAPYVEGNHLFCSISDRREHDRAPPGQRTVTVSTHLAVDRLRARPEEARSALVAEVQDRMRRTLAARAPELWAGVRHELTASPRTFARFTRRSEGLVGGIPRRAGLAAYRHLWPRPVLPGLYLVGDTVFPGQSTLAALIGGEKAAALALRGPLAAPVGARVAPQLQATEGVPG